MHFITQPFIIKLGKTDCKCNQNDTRMTLTATRITPKEPGMTLDITLDGTRKTLGETRIIQDGFKMILYETIWH
jgi:hypothetical protein